MEKEKSILPEDFDGVFRFTNFTKSEFKAKWNNVEYTFPPESTTPMVIPGFTPEEVQTIRKKFAKELAILEFYTTAKFKKLDKTAPGGTPPTYNESDLADSIQKCLTTLPAGRITARQLPKSDEKYNRRDEHGELVTKPLDKNASLLKQGSGAINE